MTERTAGAKLIARFTTPSLVATALALLASVDLGAAEAVPSPRAAKTEYLIGAHYFPGWQTGGRVPWQKPEEPPRDPWQRLEAYPERKPLLGFYDEGDPTVADWEILLAMEHGLSYFAYCWYRDAANLGRPVTDEAHFHRAALHDGFFRARHRDRFRFAIMFENAGGRGIKDVADLLDNVAPYWIERYFKRSDYLTFDGKPVLFLYSLRDLTKDLGSEDAVASAIAQLRAKVRSAGFPGIVILVEHRFAKNDTCTRLGFDAVFAYDFPINGRNLHADEAAQRQIDTLKLWRDTWRQPFVSSASMGWDPRPWTNEHPRQPWYHADKMGRWRLAPPEFERLLREMKVVMDGQPASAIGRRLALLSCWNEWGEGAHLAPHAEAGFGYLEAIRRVFARDQSAPAQPIPAASLDSLYRAQRARVRNDVR